MANLSDMVSFCDERVKTREIKDFPGAFNGLQFENDGRVTRIGAAVDAGLVPFQMAVERGIDFLIVHHGMFWDPPIPLTGAARRKIALLMEGNCAVYGSHLPLDLHPEIGNNAILAGKIELPVVDWFLEYEGRPVGAVAGGPIDRKVLSARLKERFPNSFRAIEFGSTRPERVGILTGSGQSAVGELKKAGLDTLVTGELKQNVYNLAQEQNLNLYLCGHYHTEIPGVCALAREAAARFDLPWEFLPTGCPL